MKYVSNCSKTLRNHVDYVSGYFEWGLRDKNQSYLKSLGNLVEIYFGEFSILVLIWNPHLNLGKVNYALILVTLG